MLEAIVAYLFYLVLSGIFLAAYWGIQIWRGKAKNLDPENPFVRAFTRRSVRQTITEMDPVVTYSPDRPKLPSIVYGTTATFAILSLMCGSPPRTLGGTKDLPGTQPTTFIDETVDAGA